MQRGERDWDWDQVMFSRFTLLRGRLNPLLDRGTAIPRLLQAFRLVPPLKVVRVILRLELAVDEFDANDPRTLIPWRADWSLDRGDW